MYIVVTLMTFVVLLLLIASLYVLSSPQKKEPYLDLSICGIIVPERKVNCHEYLVTCHKGFYDEHMYENGANDALLSRFEMATQKVGEATWNLGGCAIPYHEFKDFEIGPDCPKGMRYMGKNIGCFAKPGEQNSKKVDAIPGIRVAGPGLKKTVRTPVLSDAVKHARARTSKFASSNPKRTGGFDPIIPSVERLPMLQDIAPELSQYKRLYDARVKEFDTLPTRCGYIKGTIWNSANWDGKEEIIPIVQKKFGEKYYSLLYRYGHKALKSYEGDNIAGWFSAEIDWEKPNLHGEMLQDPMTMKKNIDELINSDTIVYRERYLAEHFRHTEKKFSVIVEVCNKANGPSNPILSLEFTRFHDDMPDKDEIDFRKWFSKLRLVESPYTTNKILINEQHRCSTFAIDCGNEHSWTIGYVNGMNCDSFPVYMTIITKKNKDKNNKNCAWKNWFFGYIMASKINHIDLAAPIENFEQFKKQYQGEWMNVWICKDQDDEFQKIEMTPGSTAINGAQIKQIFLRPQNATDEQWAVNIWNSLTQQPSAQAKQSEGYKMLMKTLKGKSRLTMKDFDAVCNIAYCSNTTRQSAIEVGCIPSICPLEKDDE